MPDLVVDMAVKVVEFAPAVAVLWLVSMRAEQRAQVCLERLIAHLEQHDSE